MRKEKANQQYTAALALLALCAVFCLGLTSAIAIFQPQGSAGHLSDRSIVDISANDPNSVSAVSPISEGPDPRGGPDAGDRPDSSHTVEVRAEEDGMSVVIATHRRAATLKLYLPRYLTVPIVREVIVCNDFNSPDYDDLLAWLPGSGLSPEDQARMRLVGDTGARLGGFRNKVRCLGLARFAWAAILDSDNFASPEHYWAPLASHWKSVYGAAPPPPGTRDAERRAFNPGLWMQASVPLGPTEMTGSNWAVSIARMCSPEGEKIAAPQEGAPLDARAAVGRGCWTAAWQGEGIFLNTCNHVVHRPTFYPVYKGPADFAAADPELMEPFGADCNWLSYIAVSAGLLLNPVPGFFHDHLKGDSTGNSWYLETAGKAQDFCVRHNLGELGDGAVGPRHPAPP